MKVAFGLLAFGFGLGLAYVVGTRLSPDALGMLLGAGLMAGFACAMILVLIWAMGRRGQPEPMPERHGQQQLPGPGNVFILPGGAQQATPWSQAAQQPPQLMPAPRNFRMVGDEWGDEES